MSSIIDIWHEALIRQWNKLEAEGKENWIREEQRDAARYQELLNYAKDNVVLLHNKLKEFEEWRSNRNPNGFWASRYARGEDDTLEIVDRFLMKSRARIDAAIEESQQYECRVLATVAEAIRVPRISNGAADSLAMVLEKTRRQLPNVKEYVEMLYNGLGDIREKRRIRTDDRGRIERRHQGPRTHRRQEFRRQSRYMCSVSTPLELCSQRQFRATSCSTGRIMELGFTPSGSKLDGFYLCDGVRTGNVSM